MNDIYILETNLDLKQNLNIYAVCKQLDTLHLIFNVYDDGIQADLANHNVRLKAMKSDKVPLIQETDYTVSGNMVTIIAHEQLTTASGITLVELQFINKTTGEKKATFNLNLKVIASTLEIDRSISTATYTLLEELENKIDQALDIFENIDEAVEVNTTLVATTNNAINTNSTLNTTISTGNTLKTNLSTVNNTASTNITNLTTQNTTAITNKTNLTTENVRAEANITTMQRFGDVSALTQNVTNLKMEIENARNGEINLDTRLDKFSTQLSDLTYQVAEGQYTLASNGTLYNITTFDDTLKTLTLDNVSGLVVGDKLDIKVSNAKSLIDIPITAINGLIVTLDTTNTISASWKYSIKKNATMYPVHAEGSNTIASGDSSHAEGGNTIASGRFSHTEGNNTLANGMYSHAEGNSTATSSNCSHAEGLYSLASNGTLYKITAFNDTSKTITLDNVTSLIVGDKLNIKVNNSAPLVNIPITAINGLVVTLNTTNILTSSWKYAIRDSISTGPSHAEGSNTTASNDNSHAEGNSTLASGLYSHAEGYTTIASGHSSHAEGSNTLASGDNSHAEGNATTASGINSHAEGYTTIASGHSSHAEGNNTIANSNYSHSEGNNTLAGNTFSHSEGSSTVASGLASHAEGYCTLASNGILYNITTFDNTLKTITLDNVTSLIVGDKLTIRVSKSKSLINIPILSINGLVVTLNTTSTLAATCKYAIKEIDTMYPSHAEGNNTTATGVNSHAEGSNTLANGDNSHAEGDSTVASANSAHAEGTGSIAKHLYSHAEGVYTLADGMGAHAEGIHTTAINPSHAEGNHTTASGLYSHVEGNYTTATRYCSHVMGQYNKVLSGSATAFTSTADAFVIGNGTSDAALSNAFRVTFDGKTYGLSAFNSTGADYAEYFEWEDGNINNEDRVGYFVTLDGDKIRLANSNDDYILGVVSATPSVIGDNQEAWKYRYITDEFGRVQYHNVVIPASYKTISHEAVYDNKIINDVLDDNGNIVKQGYIEQVLITEAYNEQIIDQEEKMELHPIYNPDWDSNKEYITREHRAEWSPIGMMGKLIVRDDGTCVVNGYCKPNNDGIATKSLDGYRVMKRVKNNLILVLVK